MTNINYNQLPEEKKILKACSPLLVSSFLDPNIETAESIYVKQEKFLSLSQKNKDKLASTQIVQKIQAVGQKYGFELLRLANITRLIREYYFGEIRLENFPAEIEKRVGVNLLTAQEIARYIKQEIIDWDPWGEYIAKLPKMPIREIVAKYPKIAETEITAGYIELRNSEDLSDPTIKNWLQDYISHLGYAKHSQMDRTQYIFHSENGKNLSSQDREKLGIILRSFDENIPLPVDEENGEIVFDIVEQKSPSGSPFRKGGEAAGSLPFVKTNQNFPLSQRGIKGDFEKATVQQESFIKPYAPISQPQRLTSPQPSPYKGEGDRPSPVRLTSPQNFIRPVVSQLNRQAIPPSHIAPQSEAGREIDKYFNTPESPDIPPLKIHSITEHNEPKIVPQAPPRPIPNIQRPIQTLPPRQASSPQPEARPKYKIIDPFGPKMVEPRLDGNIVDLSSNGQ